MFDKDINKIELSDIQNLIDNSVCEYRSLDYKQELHLDRDEDKKEFLYDISSFANAIGGYIIFGVEEDHNENVPKSIVGIPYESEDKLIRRIEDFVRQSIKPVILNIEYKVIPYAEKTCVLIIHIPESVLAPHRTEFKGSHKFYTRNSKGKYEMDVSELRLAFNSGIDLSKRIDDYKMERYGQIIANRNNLLDDSLPVFVMHYFPLSSFNNSINYLSVTDIKNAMNISHSNAFGYGIEQHITVDGVQLISYRRSKDFHTYAYYKNNGIVEKATNDFFIKGVVLQNVHPPRQPENLIAFELFFLKIIEDYQNTIGYLKTIGIEAPLILSCSILNGRTYTIMKDKLMLPSQLGRIDRDILNINDLYIENLDEPAKNVLKPFFDSVWNACGYEKCFLYDEK